MSNLQERVTGLVGKSSDAGKKVYSATMYIPNMALELSGEVFISAKQFVFALNTVKLEFSLCNRYRVVEWFMRAPWLSLGYKMGSKMHGFISVL